MTKTHKFSVIICTKNRNQDLMNCIESLLHQRQLPNEIIVIDSSDTDMLRSKLKSIDFKITYRHAKNSLTQARNLGIENSTGDFLLFIDDDTILDKNYIKEIMYIFDTYKNVSVGGITGNIINDTQRRNDDSLFSLIKQSMENIFSSLFFLFKYGDGKFQPSGWPTFVKDTSKDRFVECLSGANMVFRKDLLIEFRFDENLTQYCIMEDCDIAYRVSRKHTNIFAHRAKLIHVMSPGARNNEYEKIKMLVENHYYLFKKNIPQTLKNRFAFWWSMIGLFFSLIISVNVNGLKGFLVGLIKL